MIFIIILGETFKNNGSFALAKDGAKSHSVTRLLSGSAPINLSAFRKGVRLARGNVKPQQIFPSRPLNLSHREGSLQEYFYPLAS